MDYAEELEAALRLMKQAKNLGSVMKLSVSDDARTFIEQRFAALEHTDYRDFNYRGYLPKLETLHTCITHIDKKVFFCGGEPSLHGSRKYEC